MLDEVLNNIRYLRATSHWYTAYFICGKCEADGLDYFKGPTYMNRLSYFEILFYDSFLLEIEACQRGLEKTIRFLNDRNQ
jgi:hypothetical protein